MQLSVENSAEIKWGVLHMQRFIILIVFLNSYLAFPQSSISAQNTPNPNQKIIDSITKSWQKLNDSISENWQITTNSSTVRAAVVMAEGKTPNGKTQMIFLLQCSTDTHFVVIDYIVPDSDKITDFDFSSFEGPNAPASKKKLVEFRATSPSDNLFFHDYVAGRYGSLGQPNAFTFGNGTTKPNQIMQLARMTVKDSAKITFVVHDYRDYSKTIETTFPAIDASSEVAKILNDCRLSK